MSKRRIKQAIDTLAVMPLKPNDLILVTGELDSATLVQMRDQIQVRCGWNSVLVLLARGESLETLPMGSFLEIAEQVFKKALGPGWDEYRSATTRLLQIEKSKDATCDI